MYSITDDEFQAFQHLIYTETGITLNESKRCLVCSRLSKRLRSLRIGSYLDYYDYLLRHDSNGQELQQMVNCITTNKTDFFREQHHFHFLTSKLFPQLVAAAKAGAPRKLRIWCAASSRGHEPYSIAMTMREFAPFDSTWDTRLLASDIDTDVLDAAEQGVFSTEDLEPVAESLKQRYFQRGFGQFAGQARAKPTLRQLITFRQLNLIAEHWPIQAKFDVIFCRNVMIYFDVETQQRVIEHLTRYLKPSGYLLLGHSENIQWASHYLRPLGNTIFQFVE
jgi:chemotaxis protein methyltransferase CheR